MKNKYSLAVLAGASMWGFIGFFGRIMGGFGLERFDLIMATNLSSAFWLLIAIFIKGPKLLKMKWKDVPIMAMCGLFSAFLFHLCFYTAINIINMSLASILEFTSPAFVLIISLFVFKEKITPKKLLALVMSFSGCALACWPQGEISLPIAGVLLGLGSGVCYAMMSVLSRILLDRGYDDTAIGFYNCFYGFLFCMLMSNPLAVLQVVFATLPRTLIWLACGLITGCLPILLYYYGLHGIETGPAAILTTTELVVSVLVGIIIFRESFNLLSIIGLLLVLGAMIVINTGTPQLREEVK